MSGLDESPERLEASAPRVRMWDAVALGIPTTLTIPNAGRVSINLDLTAFRRYRVKWRITDDAGGISAMQLRLLDVAFYRANAWETMLIAPFAYGANGANVQNFGEGTGIFECYAGVWFRFVLFNLGPGNIRVQECELWAGS